MLWLSAQDSWGQGVGPGANTLRGTEGPVPSTATGTCLRVSTEPAAGHQGVRAAGMGPMGFKLERWGAAEGPKDLPLSCCGQAGWGDQVKWQPVGETPHKTGLAVFLGLWSSA